MQTSTEEILLMMKMPVKQCDLSPLKITLCIDMHMLFEWDRFSVTFLCDYYYYDDFIEFSMLLVFVFPLFGHFDNA
jgi:hypothetical protein